MKNIPIGEVLKEYGYIDDEQLNIALNAQKEDRSMRLGEHLVRLGFITEEQTLQALSDKLAEPIISLGTIDVSMEAVEKIPEPVAKKYNIFAYGLDETGNLMVVTNDPLNFYGIEDVRLVTGLNIKVALATKSEVNNAIHYYYQELETRKVASQVNSNVQKVNDDILDLFDANEDDTPVVKLFNSLVSRGYTNNASDIHIEPFEDEILVRMRIDGMIVDFLKLNKSLLDSLVVRIKILSNLDIAEKRIPQDGHFVGVIDGIEINARVSIIPTIFGEKVVLRFLNMNAKIVQQNTFGMTPENYKKMCKMINMPHGIIYVTGPTGSGKTTTLYMILEELSKRQINISTIEDPVEKRIDRVNQMQVNNMAGLTFESGLRALLRQDPDVIMVGETRDAETAAISVRASITGHLVFSTLHTNDAVSAIVRLEDMGVEPYMVANSLVGVVAQRLVRTICPHCKEKVPASAADKVAVGEDIDYVYHGKGCPNCNNTGYKGRMAIHEIIIIDSQVRKMVSAHADIDDIYAYIKDSQHLVSLGDGALELVKAGQTTVEELQKVVVYL
ncbi:GspE/PulE family protein [Beduini massiliensis]|uniref:GspE/PulE family protein n=1 Tax=Beduini massiliensis TaxID=1585974 RepID=UPI00059A9D05|nr:GspE/PulE family protein [Beduini massiliensis]